MSLHPDVFRAILAMDAYNRGYNEGISGLGGIGSSIGSATISLQSNSTANSPDVAASFYAVAYNWNSETIISYRGTDDEFNDPLYGYGLAIGFPEMAPQAGMAVEFYRAVNGNSYAPNSNISLTGHSLGGGLAGYVGGILGVNSMLFNNMTFELSANKVLTGEDATYAGMREDYFGSGQVRALPTYPTSGGGYYVSGEFLSYLRSASGQTTGLAPLNPDDTALDPMRQLHSQALLTVLLYAENSNVGTNWLEVRKELVLDLFDNDIATAAGANSIDGTSKNDGDFAGIMWTAIAYSAIDEGTRVFGDTGIRSIFNDANDLGEALHAQDVSSTLEEAADAITKVLVQYGGQLSIGKVLQSSEPEALDGALTLAADKQTLTVDFSDPIWQRGAAGGPTTNIIGRKETTDVVFREAGWSTDEETPPNDIRPGMKWLWNDDNSEIIDRFVFAAKEGALTATIVDRPQESERVGLFAAAGEGDFITGSRDRDFIFGGDGNDTLRGAVGDDLLAGGDGDDRLSGGPGRNYFAGGEGKDTVFYEETGNPPLDLTLTTYQESTDAGEVALQLDLSIWRVDRAMGIEKVELSNKGDTVTVPERPKKLATNVVVDGRDAPQGSDADATLADTLDFSDSADPLYIDYARTNIVTDALGLTGAPYAVELYSKYSPIVQWGQWIWNLFVPTGEPSGQGMYDGTGLRFTNFEHVIGSEHNDRMSLWRLSPGGELDAQQEIALDAARSIIVSFASGDPVTIAAGYNARTQQAGLILQNQQDVLIEGGDGNDAIVGTRTGADRIYGGDGVDHLYAGQVCGYGTRHAWR